MTSHSCANLIIRQCRSLSCPYCGADIELNDDVGIKTFYEREIEAKWEEWHKKYDPEFMEFFYHIEKFPYLGLSHKLGRQLNKKIPSLPSLTINDEKWFRARKVNNGKILASDDFYPADPKDIVVGEGRFNHFGQSVFYLVEDDHCAASEVLEEEGVVWIQEFTISHAEKIIDLSYQPHAGPDPELDILSFGLRYGGVLSQAVERSSGWKPEYFIPRFISDCAKLHGFNGIKFYSSRAYPSNNLVLFSWQKETVIHKNPPYLFELKKPEHPF